MDTSVEIPIQPDPRPRDEDRALLTGAGRFTGDIPAPHMAHMTVIRSSLAAGTIITINTTEAAGMPGVLGVFTGADVAADGLGPIRPKRKFDRPDGSPMFEPGFHILAPDKAHCVGDALAVVIAETARQAEDAADAVIVDMEPTPAVADVAEAVKAGAPTVWPDAPGNIAFQFQRGDAAATARAFEDAAHVVELTLRNNRVAAHPMEPRIAQGSYDSATGTYTLTASLQAPFRIRDALAEDVLRIEPEKLRVIAPDVGGAFGMKNALFPEYGLVLWAAKRLGQPVRWTGTRSECFISDCHARDNLTSARLALDAEGNFLGLEVKTLANLGAYLNLATAHPPTGNLGGLAGVYRTPHVSVHVDAVHTHTHSTAPYRGAGRPEATYVIERLVDLAAIEMGMDRAALRRRNLIRPADMPYKTGLIFTYDCGEFEALMDEALAAADWDGFEARRVEAQARGMLRGIGIANPIEIAGGPAGTPNPEYGAVSIDGDGRLTLKLGSLDSGQGHTTAFRSLAHQVLGIAPELIELVAGDTGRVARGTGSFGSRTLCAAGAAFLTAAEKVIEAATSQAAAASQVTPEDISFDRGEGVLRARDTNAVMSLAEAARAAGGSLEAEAFVSADGATFPNGCHICEVEVDPETGAVQVISYVVVDDVGTVLNPMIVKGQIQGGVAQGLGQALMEEMVYDGATAQLLSGSFQDYAMPRATDISDIQVLSRPVPTAATPFGVKGVGEAGTVGALPAVVGAVVDSLAPLGIKHLDMPLTPERVWTAIRSADGGI